MCGSTYRYSWLAAAVTLQRKLLAIYLHHDGSIVTNVFCQQILCSDPVISYLCNHFLLWGWDVTSDANLARLMSMCTQHFGSQAAQTVRSFSPDDMPLLLVISRNRATNEVVQVIKGEGALAVAVAWYILCLAIPPSLIFFAILPTGNATIDELVTQLMHCVEVFQHQQQTDIAEEVGGE